VNVPAVAVPDSRPDPQPKTRWGLIIGAIAGGLVLLGGIVTVIIIMTSGGDVPDLTGKTLKEAEELLAAADLAIGDVTERTSTELQPGQIIEQLPKAGEELPDDKLVDLVVALLTHEVPSVVGLNVPSAEAKLIAAGFTRGEITIKATGESPGGAVIGQSRQPPDREIPGTPIGLTVERQLVRVPPLAGLPIDRAVAALEGAGLSRGETQTADTGAPQLTVVGQNPQAGQDVDPGAKIDLLVEGRKVKVPSVLNLDLAQATTVLTHAGFKVANVGHVNVETGARIGTVRTQDPEAGKEVAPGRDVNLVVRQRPFVLGHVTLQQAHVAVLTAGKVQSTATGVRMVAPEETRSVRISISADACKPGFVWREAFEGDHVCVSAETRAQVQRDNGLANERRQPGGGAFGPDTCRQGFVWRDARQGDHVCVPPETRTQAAVDNAQAASRRLGTT
jgi:beta-lactam-binding protein with PASTA domain